MLQARKMYPKLRILSVEGQEPNREGEYPMLYTVGKEVADGITVTKIEWRDEYRGDHSIGNYIPK